MQKQFVPPTNRTHGPQINARNTGMVGKKTEMGKIRVLGETLQGVFTARSKADSRSRPCEELSQRAS